MRTSILLVIFCLSLFSVHAQDAEPLSRTVFKLSPQHFIHNSLKAGVERFNSSHSGSVTIFITGMLANNNDSYFWDGYDGLAGELQFRKYISPMKPRTSKRNNLYHQGVYGAAYMQGGNYSGEFKGESGYYDRNTGTYELTPYDYKETIGNWGFGFTIGYQKTLWQVIFVEAFIGGGIQFSDRIVTGLMPDPSYYSYSGIIDPDYKGILPKMGIQIGIGL